MKYRQPNPRRVSIRPAFMFLALLFVSSIRLVAQCPVASVGTTSAILIGSISNSGNAIDGNLNTSATINSGLFLTSVQMNVNLSKPANPGDTVYVYYSIPVANLANWGSLGSATFTGYTGTNGSGSSTGTNNSSTLGFIIQLGATALTRITFVVSAPTQSVNISFVGISFANNANPGVAEVGVVPGPPANTTTAAASKVCYNMPATVSVSKSTAGGNTTVINLYNSSNLSPANLVASNTFTASGANTSSSNNVLMYTTPNLTANTTYYAVEYTQGCTSAGKNVEYAPSAVTPISVTVDPQIKATLTLGCSGNTNIITAQGSGGTGPYTYNWLSPSASTGNTKSVTGNGTYEVVIMDAAGCTIDTTLAVAGYNPNSCSASLPVTLNGDLTGNFSAGVVTLNWQTKTEINNKGFEIWKSLDGKTFNYLTSVGSNAVNGNSNQPLSYSATDANPANGTNYYQLKQIDLDGKSVIVQTISVAVSGMTSAIQIFPNPVLNTLNIKDIETGASYRILDIGGRVVVPATLLTNTQIHLDGLASGVYILLITSKNSKTQSVKFIKK